MPSIADIAKQLAQFSDADIAIDRESKANPTIELIENDLSALEDLDRDMKRLFEDNEKKEDEIISRLRTQFKIILTAVTKNKLNNIIKDEIALGDLAYNALLVLAEFKPINPIDFVTQEAIPVENKVFVSTGHQFDMTTYVQWHRDRKFKEEGGLEEFRNSKWLINPWGQNDKFSERDVAHLVHEAGKKNLVIPDIRTEAQEQADQAMERAAQEAAQARGQRQGGPVLRLFRPYVPGQLFFVPIPAEQNAEEAVQAIGAFIGMLLMRSAVRELAANGLTLEQLQTSWPPEKPFSGAHQNALIYLIRGMLFVDDLDRNLPALPPAQRLTPQAAIEEIKFLNQDQTNALIELYSRGLRAQHFIEWRRIAEVRGIAPIPFTAGHREALIHLMRQQNSRPDDAVLQLIGKTDEQALDLIPFLHRPAP